MADVHAYLAAAYVLNGETEHADAELARARRLVRDNRYSSITRLKAVGSERYQIIGVPKIQTLFENTFFAALRKAGMPEE